MSDLPNLPKPIVYNRDSTITGALQWSYTSGQMYEYALAARAPLEAEIAAWKERFPQYVYRPQDDCVTLTAAIDQTREGK